MKNGKRIEFSNGKIDWKEEEMDIEDICCLDGNRGKKKLYSQLELDSGDK